MGLSSSLSIAIFLLYFTSVLAGPDKKKPDYLTQIDGLDTDYYRKTCPKAEEIISKKVKHWISKDYTLGASLLRLHFHDCAIRVRDSHTISKLVLNIFSSIPPWIIGVGIGCRDAMVQFW